uniref:Uncharacterized protein n=2 Tax=Clytia hemisphaerica TaxID=252671 RepID=A0A7M5U3L3_9CNID
DYLPNFLKRKITMPLIKSFSDIHQANDAQPDAQALSSKPSQSMYACYSEKSPASKPGVRKSPRTTALSKQYGEMDNGKPQQTLASKYPYAFTVLMIFAYKFFIASTDVMIKVEKHLKIYLKIALHYFYRFQSRAQKALRPYFIKLIQYARKRGFNLNGIRKKYLTLNMIVFVLPFVLGVMLLDGYQYSRMQIDDIGSMIPNSIKMNIPAKENVTFWHVPPSGQTYEGSIAENLNDGNNIVIHLRDEAFGNSYHRTNVFKVLSDAGFHVIIPNEPIQETDFLSLWTGVKVLLDKNQDMYIWSDIQNVGHTTPYVDLLTQSSLYPKGVIIESTVRDNFDSVRNLEIWKATTKNGYLSNAPTLNYLKCPLTTPSYKLNHLREEIALCINTVSFNADFKMRQ